MGTLILGLIGAAIPALFAAAYRHPTEYRTFLRPLAVCLIFGSFCCMTAFQFAIDLALEEIKSPQLTPLMSTYASEQLRFAVESYMPRKRWYALHLFGIAYVAGLSLLPDFGFTSKPARDNPSP
jgi:hypothetical protein